MIGRLFCSFYHLSTTVTVTKCSKTIKYFQMPRHNLVFATISNYPPPLKAVLGGGQNFFKDRLEISDTSKNFLEEASINFG